MPLDPTVRCSIALLSITCVTLGGADDTQPKKAPLGKVAQAILGEWVQYQDTPNGRFMTIKEHDGKHTILTIYDPQKNPIYSHRSDYVVDESGDASIFRYKNKIVLVGDNAGAKSSREDAYLLKVQGDKFYEVHGMLTDETQAPSVKVWQRLKNNPIPNPDV